MRKVKGKQRILAALLCVGLVLQGMPLEAFAVEVSRETEIVESLEHESESSEIKSRIEINTEQETETLTETEGQENYSETGQIFQTESGSEEETTRDEEVETNIEIESENEEITTEEIVLQEGEILSGKCGDNLTWTIENETLTISGMGDMWDYDTEYDYNLQRFVTTAGWGVYTNILKNLTLEKGITSIGNHAFYECYNFNGDLKIPNGITSIGECAFYGCYNFNGDLKIPNSVTSIGENAFLECCGFSGNLEIPSKVTTIGKAAFLGCSGFDGELILPNSIRVIEEEVFYFCNGFSGNIEIPNSVISIEKEAFGDCNGFNGKLIIPNSVINIGESAFSGCSSLSGDLEIPSSVASIGMFAFSGCSGFNGKLMISNNLKIIERGVFTGCNNFSGNLEIPSNVTSIGGYAFEDCSGFSGNLTIPNSVTNIEEYAFYKCVGFNGELTIPSGVTNIGEYAFYNCRGFDGELIIPSGVTNIGEYAFYNCRGFDGELIIPSGVTNIGEYAFYNCRGFDGELIIPSRVTNIGEYAFAGCIGFAEKLTIQNSVISIGKGAFYNCINLSDVYVTKYLVEIGKDAFKSVQNNIEHNLPLTFHCPKNSYAYNWAVENGFKVVEWDGGSTGGDVPPDDDTSGKCGDNLTWKLKDDKDYYTLTISGTGNMYDYALEKNISTAPYIEHIKSKTVVLKIEEGVTSIGKYAFYDCENINGNVIIPSSVTTIGDSAFYNCTGITDIYMRDTLTQIGRNPFQYFNALIGTFKNMELTLHCIKDSYAYKWAKDNGFTVEEWDGSTIDIKKDNITINGRGYAYATFKLVDNSGIIQKNTKINYSFGGKSYTATSDKDGYVQIKSEEVSADKPISKLIKTTKIILDPNGKNEKLDYRVVMDVDVHPFTYTQTWKLGASGSAKVGVAEALGLELGTAELEASLGGANITGSQKGTVSVKQEIVGNTKNIELTQNLNSKIGLKNSIGPEAKAKAATKGMSVEPLTVSGEGSVGYGSSIGLKIDNYDPGNFNQNLKIGKFIIAMSAHQAGSTFWVKVVDMMGLDVYNVSEVSVGLMGKAGANVGSIKYGDKDMGTLANLEGSISYTYADGKDETSKSLTKETKMVASVKGGVMNTGLGDRTKIFSSNLKAGYAAKISEDYNHNLKKMLLSVDTSQTVGTLFEDTTQAQKLSVEFDAAETQKILNNASKLKNWYMGISSFILDGKGMFQQVEETDAIGKYNCSTISTTGSEYTFSIGGKAGADIGLKLGLEGAYDLGYSTESGAYEHGSVTKTAETSNVSDLLSQTSMWDVTSFFTDPVEIALNSAKNFIADVWDDFKNGVENAYAKVESVVGDTLEGIGNWAVHIISLSPIKNQSITSYSIMAVNSTSEGEQEEKLVYTIGDAYIVYVTNEKEERVDDFTAHPLNLTLEYTEDMLFAAGLNKENTDSISIYMYDEELCGYVCIGGTVDAKNNTVTVEITKSGEYILATDTTAPTVIGYTVSENTNKPLITIDFEELSSFQEFSLKLDEVEVIDTANWKNYYNKAYNRISYQVENELSGGTHKVSVYAVDSAGNAMSEPFTFEFYIEGNGENPSGPEPDYGDILPEDIPTDGVIPRGLWISNVEPQNYTGKAIKPQIRVYDYKNLLTEKRDYTISYKNNINASGAKTAKTAPTITVMGKGNYTGKETAVFEILPIDISDENIEIEDITLPYNKKAQKPTPVILWNGKKLKPTTEFQVQYTDKSAQAYQGIGSYKIVVTGKGNFSGQRELEINITNNKLIAKTKVDKIANQPYTGKEVKPKITIKQGKTLLKEGKDYTLAYRNNIEVGKASVTVSGIGEYSGKKTIYFNISGGSIAKAVITGLSKTASYTGSEITQSCTLTVALNGSTKTLKKGTDYTVSYVNNIRAGKATIIFKGINGFSGVLKQSFTIAPFDIGSPSDSKFKITMPKTVPYAKGGSAPKPEITFDGKTLYEGTDYTLSYKNNKDITANGKSTKNPQVTVKGKGNFNGARSLDFQIAVQDISKLTLNAADQMYQSKRNVYGTKVEIADLDGKKLSAGKDYDKNLTYTYAENTTLSDGVLKKAGEAVGKNDRIPAGTSIRVSAAGRGSYTGTISGEYRITKADIGKASVKIASQTYTGGAVELDKSAIEVKISGKKLADDCYKVVKYDNNVNKGSAAVTIKGVGDYGGVKTVKFTIRSKGFLWWWRK